MKVKLHLPVIRVERDSILRGASRYRVTLSDDWGTTVYTTATQPAVGQPMVVTIEPEAVTE